MPYTKERRRAKQDAGFCARCLCKPAIPGRTRCLSCAAINTAEVRAWQKRCNAKGLCQCGEPLAQGRKRCLDCLAAKMRQFRDRVAAGLCPQCGESAEAGRWCLKHWFAQEAAGYGIRTTAGVAMLKRLWAQQSGRCAMTGEPLIPGRNASLDHILASSRGGQTIESNLQWVTRKVNWLKGDMSLEELIVLCRAVLAHQHSEVVR